MARVAERPLHRSSLSVIAFAHGTSDFYSGIVPLVVFYVVAREGLSPAVQGALTFLWYLTSSIVQPLFGAYSDRSGRWWFLPWAVATTTVSVSLIGLASTPLELAACIVAGGLGSAIMHPEAGKYTALVSGSKRASGISVFQIGGQIGYSLGPAFAGLLLGRFGGAGLVPLGIAGLLGAAFVFVRMPSVDRVAQGAHRASRASAAGAVAIDRVGVTLIAASTALRYFVTAAIATFLPNVLVGAGLSLSVAGLIVSAFLLVSAVGLFAGGLLSDRLGAIAISVGTLAAAVPFLLGFFYLIGGAQPNYVAAVPLLMIASVLLAAQNAPGVALVQAMMPKNLGMALGLMNGVAFGAGSAGVALAGLLVARYGAATTLGWVSWAPLLAAAAFLAVRGRPSIRATD